MRIWDIFPKKLCNKHLFGEHRELHAIFSILTNDKKGYRNHPETKRWVGKLKALYGRHEKLVKEIKRRGYKHQSPLDEKLASGKLKQDEFVNTKAEQKIILKHKDCDCPL
ncbi:MAG: pyrimidine dimer DNA glycosylase/endonuclease V [bacterium]